MVPFMLYDNELEQYLAASISDTSICTDSRNVIAERLSLF